MVHLELSVRFKELREEFNHLIECHWVPLQQFSQGVLATLSVLSYSSSYPSPPSKFLNFRSTVWERLEKGSQQLSEEEFQALFLNAEGNSSESRTAATDGSEAILFRIAEGVQSGDGSGGNGEDSS